MYKIITGWHLYVTMHLCLIYNILQLGSVGFIIIFAIYDLLNLVIIFMLELQVLKRQFNKTFLMLVQISIENIMNRCVGGNVWVAMT